MLLQDRQHVLVERRCRGPAAAVSASRVVCGAATSDAPSRVPARTIRLMRIADASLGGLPAQYRRFRPRADRAANGTFERSRRVDLLTRRVYLLGLPGVTDRGFRREACFAQPMLFTRARLLTLVCLCALPATTQAQTPDDTLQVPVGTLKVLGVPTETSRPFAMLRAIRVLYSSPRRDPIPQAIADFERLLDGLERLDRELKRSGTRGIVLGDGVERRRSRCVPRRARHARAPRARVAPRLFRGRRGGNDWRQSARAAAQRGHRRLRHSEAPQRRRDRSHRTGDNRIATSTAVRQMGRGRSRPPKSPATRCSTRSSAVVRRRCCTTVFRR